MNNSINSTVKKIVSLLFLMLTIPVYAVSLVYCPSAIFCPNDDDKKCVLNENNQFFKSSGGRYKKTGGTYILDSAFESNSRYGHSTGCHYVLDNYFTFNLMNIAELRPFIDNGAPWNWDATNRTCIANGNPGQCPFAM